MPSMPLRVSIGVRRLGVLRDHLGLALDARARVLDVARPAHTHAANPSHGAHGAHAAHSSEAAQAAEGVRLLGRHTHSSYSSHSPHSPHSVARDVQIQGDLVPPEIWEGPGEAPGAAWLKHGRRARLDALDLAHILAVVGPVLALPSSPASISGSIPIPMTVPLTDFSLGAVLVVLACGC